MHTKLLLLFAFMLTLNLAWAQKQFTPYDELPGMDKSVKPSYSEDYESWEKMLYQYPVNFLEIQTEYEKYLSAHPKAKSAIVRYYKLWSRIVVNYANEAGEIIIPDIFTLEQQLQDVQRNAQNRLKSSANSVQNWTFLGPTVTTWLNDPSLNAANIDENGHPKQCPWQANVYSFDVAASDPNVLFCGTETGFVNKSTDKGLTWNPVSLNYPFGGGITAVAIHPQNKDIVYVTGGRQIHLSKDGGLSWTPLLTPGNTFNTTRLKINSENPDILVAAASEGLFISKDGGISWVKKWSKVVWDAEFKPGTTSNIYGLTKNDSGIFEITISTDGGESFSVSPLLNNYPEQSGGLLAVTPANPDILYATLLAKEGSENLPYILKATNTDGALTWELRKAGQYYSVGGLGGFTNGQGYFDLVLEASPTDENIIFWGTCSLWKSTNGGVDYTPVGGYNGSYSIHPDIQDMKMLANDEIWVATDGGMNYSSDNFTNPVNYSSRTYGILGSDMWGFDQGWNEDIVVGGRYHNGNTAIAESYEGKALRMGGGESPTGWVIKGKSRHVAYNDLGNGWILPKTSDGYAEGRFIFSKYPNMDEYGGRRSNLIQHPFYYNTIYLGEEDGLWKSTDMGVSYNLLHQFPGRVRYFQISHINPDIMFADIVGYGLFKSTDGGNNWTLKPALTNGTAGNSNWNGKLFFALSPTDENKIYACLQNGTWSSDIGKVFRSNDGGETWSDWTEGLTEYTKCLVVQPTKNSDDRVYLFTSSINNKMAKVYTREENQPSWMEFDGGYPAGVKVNLALPFYRDGKIRVSGNAGVWESYMVDTTFVPLATPWVQNAAYDCMEDTLYFDDHSILNHEGATWNWEIEPQPAFIDNPDSRNPKVVLGNPGSYDVTLNVTIDGQTYSRTITNMVETTTCPSVEDCSNPGSLDASKWKLLYVDSQETAAEDGKAINAFDGESGTIWHTSWSQSSPAQPHEIQIDLADTFQISSLTYLPRQNSANGRIKDYEIYISDRKENWGQPVMSGTFDSGSGPKTLTFSPTTGRYFKFKSLSEQNGNNWTAIAEIDLKGCYAETITSNEDIARQDMINVYPVPCSDRLNVKLPNASQNETLLCKIYSSNGALIQQKKITLGLSSQSFDVHHLMPGMYYMMISGENNRQYRIKFIKN
ncbi:discoidin domain-containing protein [Maribellus sp. YY47]|uniref:discoidin domain-containing protein n=1 Tax=Maribellus sp. YY47 TaxID=2929486 RepID=UPI002000E325|nr:discoidin domain-containing protein [Maribellus sp. YY47]MCK3685428.1 discoidin domain-containing protein [Maribellus sp. YY47]